MEIHLTPDQEAFVRQGIEGGRFDSVEDAVREALALWEERERTRAELLAAIEQAEASIAGGKGLDMTPESISALVERVRQRGLARLQAEESDR